MRASSPRSAFTLIEVLLAVALLLALSGGMLSYIWGLLASRDRLVTATDQQISAAALFEEVETQLSTTFAVDGSGVCVTGSFQGTATFSSGGHGGVRRGPRVGGGRLGESPGCRRPQACALDV